MQSQKEFTGYPSIDKPWLKYYSQEIINTSLPECSLYEYLFEKNKDYPNDIALIYLGNKITYRELFLNIDKAAAAFRKAGVKENDIVTVALPSVPEALYCVYALNKIGAVANMIHPLAGKDETLNYFNEVGSRVAVIFINAYEEIAPEITKTSVRKVVVASPADSLPLPLKIAYHIKNKAPKLNGNMFQTWNSFIREGKGTVVEPVKKDCHETAIISHTGGTTGEPKGVMCSDFGCNALMYQLLCNFKFDRQECSLNVLPPFINYSLLESIMAMLAEGIKVVLIPKYEPLKFANYIKKYRPNQVLSIPAYWEALLRIENVEKIDMSCFKHIYSGGDKMDPRTETELNLLLERCGSKSKLYNCMGSTEMMAGATIIYDNCYKTGSVGIPMVKVGCKIVEPGSDKELSINKEGEICFSGPTLMLGYYNKPDETAEIIKKHPDGLKWLHTGDVGYINEDGVLFVTGRIKRIIMTKGRDGNITKLFPDRIENAIYAHPAVECCCVIGAPDRERIAMPAAYIVLKPDCPYSTELADEILEKCRALLPTYMIPERVEFRNDLPRTPRGKIDYRVLEQLASEKQ